MPFQNFEAILMQTGWGIYNKFVLFMCGACVFASTMAMSTLPFALSFPIHFQSFSESNVMWIYAAFPSGVLFGNILFGLFSDTISRKCVLTCTLAISFTVSFSIGFAYELLMYILFSFLLGCSTSGNILTTKVYLSEILPMCYRGYYLVILEMISILGYLMSSCINWSLLSRYNYIDPDTEESWRLAFGLPTCMCLLTVCFLGLLQPSSRELLAKNSIGTAHLVVKYMFAINTSNHAENFKINLIDLRGLIEGKSLNIYRTNKCSEYLFRICANITKIVTTILKQNLFYLFLVSFIRCSLSTGYSMTNIWLTKSLYINFTSECITKSKDLYFLLSLDNEKVTPRKFDSLIPASQLFEYFLNGGAMFLGLFIFSFLVDSVGRRVPLMVALLCSGLAITNFPIFNSFPVRLSFSIAYMMAFSIANAALDIIIIENNPTSIRTTSLIISHTPALFLSVLSRILITMDCSTFFHLIGGSAMVASGFCYFLPDLKNLPMVE